VISDSCDSVVWGLTANRIFTTKSLYQNLERNISGANNKWIWKSKLPLKIKFFMWQLFWDAILTRDKLKRRNWPGSPICSFCHQQETAIHLLFSCSHARVVWGVVGSMIKTNSCPGSLWQCMSWFHAFFPRGKKFHMLILSAVCWAIWIVRNQITFDKKVVRSPMVTVFATCAFLRYWAGLYNEEDKSKIVAGADQMMRKASELASQVAGGSRNGQTNAVGRLLITNG
jgi:hypothetical protein